MKAEQEQLKRSRHSWRQRRGSARGPVLLQSVRHRWAGTGVLKGVEICSRNDVDNVYFTYGSAAAQKYTAPSHFGWETEDERRCRSVPHTKLLNNIRVETKLHVRVERSSSPQLRRVCDCPVLVVHASHHNLWCTMCCLVYLI